MTQTTTQTTTQTKTPAGARGRRALPTPADAYRPGMTYGKHPRHRGQVDTTPEPQLPDTVPLPTFDDLLAPVERDRAQLHDGEPHGLHVISGLDTLEQWMSRSDR